MIVNRRIRPLRAAVWSVAAAALVVVACADAADPVASEAPEAQVLVDQPAGTFEFVASVDDGEIGEVELAPTPNHERPAPIEGANVMMRRTPAGEWKVEIDSLDPRMREGLVRFRTPSPEGHDIDAERFTAERVPLRLPLREMELRPAERAE